MAIQSDRHKMYRVCGLQTEYFKYLFPQISEESIDDPLKHSGDLLLQDYPPRVMLSVLSAPIVSDLQRNPHCTIVVSGCDRKYDFTLFLTAFPTPTAETPRKCYLSITL